MRGVVAKGNRLIIHLTRRDPTLLMKLAMPFFQATSPTLPLDREVVDAYPSAGPYAFTSNEANVRTELRRNSHYGGSSPHNLRGLEVLWNLDEETAFQRVESGELDEAPLPTAHVQEVATQVRRQQDALLGEAGRLHRLDPVQPPARDLHRTTSRSGRRSAGPSTGRTTAATAAAVHCLALDASAAARGSRARSAPGSSSRTACAQTSRRRRKLAAGHFRSGKVVIAYPSGGSTIRAAQAALVRRDLLRLGFKPEDVTLQPYNLSFGLPPANWDLLVGSGVCADFADPYSFFSGFLVDPLLGPPVSSLEGRYEQRLRAANRLQREPRGWPPSVASTST